MKVLGVDEAGRGPVIGSMFIGGFLVEEEKLDELSEIGVKDSKKLSDTKREEMNDQLSEVGEVFLKEFEASEIDDLMEVMTINQIEIKGFADLIEDSDPDRVIVDLPEPDGDRFISKLRELLPERFEEVDFVAEHGADEEYDVVSAGSIAAKSAREAHVKRLHEKYGYDFKSGYPHDRPTIKFLERYVEEKGELPPETRRSWSTAQRIMRESGQSELEDF